MHGIGGRRLLLTDEAIAQAALDAGIGGAYAYPGTPSTEILEYIQHAPEALARGVHRQWSVNEKTALEEGLGLSYAGRRALVSMKHVGLNVAADPFVNAAITGVNGGLVVVVADDPSMHSSQNEQDSRFYAGFAAIPLLEPATQQEAYEMTRAAFDWSEQWKIPIMIRIVTRLAHSRADVVTAPPIEPPRRELPHDPRQFVLLPANARRNYERLLDQQAVFQAHSEESPYNLRTGGTRRERGVIAAGIAYNYLMEAFADSGECPWPVLTIREYPLPAVAIARLAAEVDSLLILEEGAPLIESRLRGLLPGGKPIHGRMDGTLPRAGELTPDLVAMALGLDRPKPAPVPAVVRPRPPMLCAGCPHADSYRFLKAFMADHPAGRVFADIGCYTLGALPPFEAICSCVDMGASITMAKGAADAGLHPAIAVIGDSTFTHSGLTGLLDAVMENTPMTVLILDNETTGMTGCQTSPATGRLERIIAGLGVDTAHLRVVVPLQKNHDKNLQVLSEEAAFPGISVIISRRVCLQIAPKG
jgi:indolepyruvate ferredoxin oxidoreductase alpha subunit